MLVLTRKLSEKVYIGDEICVTIVRLENGQVRLGIDAPRTISVVRAELRKDGASPAAPSPCEPPITPRRLVPLGTGIRRRGPSR